MNFIVKTNQSIFDVALEACGTITTIPQIMIDNQLTEFPPQLTAGQKLSIAVDFENFTQKEITKKLTARPIATNSPQSIGGIGAMIIEDTFIVS